MQIRACGSHFEQTDDAFDLGMIGLLYMAYANGCTGFWFPLVLGPVLATDISSVDIVVTPPMVCTACQA